MDLNVYFLGYLLNTFCGPNVQQTEMPALCYDLDGDMDVDLKDFAEYQLMNFDCETGYDPDRQKNDCAFWETTYANEVMQKDNVYENKK